MEIAVLTATLEAQIAGFQRNMAAADAIIASARASLKRLEDAAAETTAMLGRVKISSGQALETDTALESMKRSVGNVNSEALKAADHLAEVRLKADAAAETVANAEIEKRALKSVEEQAIRTRIAAGGGGAGGLLAGLLPGGARPGAAAVTAGLGLAAAAGPGIIPGLLAAAPVLGAGFTTLIGAAGTLKLALGGITAQAFSTQKAFDALTPTQQRFVTSLRSLDAGLAQTLEGIAQKTLLPQLTQALHTAFTPGVQSTLAAGVGAFSGAIGGGANQVASLFSSSGFQANFGRMIQQDAGYLRQFFSILTNLLDAFVRFQASAGPFLNWLGQIAVGFSKWADQSVRADQSNGRLAQFFNVMKQSLQTIATLLGSVIHLGRSFVDAVGFQNSLSVVKLLATAINDLAGLLRANAHSLRDFFVGALLAARDMLNLVNQITKAIAPLLSLLDRLVGGVKGWQTIIDSLAVVWVARFAMMRLATVNLATETSIAGARLRLLQTGLAGLAGKIFTVGLILSIIPRSSAGQNDLNQAGVGFLGHLPVVGSLAQQEARLAFYLANKINPATAGMSLQDQLQIAYNRTQETSLAQSAVLRARMVAHLHTTAARSAAGGTLGLQNILDYITAAQTYTSAFGTPAPLAPLPGNKIPFSGIGVLPAGIRNALLAAQTNVAGQGSIGATTPFSATAMRALIGEVVQYQHALDYITTKLGQQGLSQKQILALEKERLTIAKELGVAQKKVGDEIMAQHRAIVSHQIDKILGIGSGAIPGTASLLTRERHVLLAEIARFGHVTGHGHFASVSGVNLIPGAASMPIEQLIRAMQAHGINIPKSTLESLHKINEAIETARKERNKLTSEQSQAITARLAQINDTLKTLLGGHPSGYRAPSIADLTRGLGHLGSPAARKIIADRLAEIMVLGGEVPKGPSSFGYPVHAGQGMQVIHIHGDMPIHVSGLTHNAAEIARGVRAELTKTARRNATQTRGPNAGRNLGHN